jgi:hypothetical protein
MYGIPLIIILSIAIYLGIKQWTMTVEPIDTITEAKFKILFEYWYLVLVAIIAYVYMQFIAPKIFND